MEEAEQEVAPRRWMSLGPSRPIVLHPGFAGLTAVLGGLAGVLGSLYTEDIRQAFPFAIGPVFVPKAAAFWASLLMFGWCFAKGFGAQLKAQAKQSGELQESIEKLERVIRTLPPEGFLSEFEDFYSMAFTQAQSVRDEEATKEELFTAIQTCLLSLLALAHAFDGSPKHLRFAANLMIFRPIPADPQHLLELQRTMIFMEGGADLTKLAGYLELLPAFRTAIDREDLQDAVTPTICLPVPRAELRTVGARTTVLPGASSAYCAPHAISWWRDTTQLGQWCRENTALRAEVAAQMEHYFEGDGRSVRSFVCLPFGTTDDESWKDVLGIVNIHSDDVDILGDTGVRQFVPLARPFMLLLSELWMHYDLLSKSVAISSKGASGNEEIHRQNLNGTEPGTPAGDQQVAGAA